MVQIYMSKTMSLKEKQVMLTSAQFDLAHTLYFQWVRIANDIGRLATRESSPRKAQKIGGGGKLFRGKELVEDDCGSAPAARKEADGFDPVAEEIERWERLSSDVYEKFTDDDHLLNEFEMMWALRKSFPLHFIVFKQTACHLAHEANVEQIFSRAGNLSDPNMDPEFLAHIVMVAVNKKAFCPTMGQIKDKYYEMFRGKGGEGEDDHEAREGGEGGGKAAAAGPS